MRVAFVGFWEGFRPDDFFLPLVCSASGQSSIHVSENDHPDVVFHSVFQSPPRPGLLTSALMRLIPRTQLSDVQGDLSIDSTAVNIWYTGENVRPPFSKYDATLSFDHTEGRNFRLPLWWLLFPFPGRDGLDVSETKRVGVGLQLAEALSGRTVSSISLSRRACVFMGKSEPTRLRLIEAVEKVMPVDRFGPAFGKRVESKYSIAKDYSFMICPENDLYPGYVTEKAIEAWACRTIPIYSGLDSHGDLNRQAVVWHDPLHSTEKLRQQLEQIVAEPKRMIRLMEQPILSRAPDYEALAAFVRNSVLEKKFH